MKFSKTVKLLGSNHLSDEKDSLQLHYDIDPIKTRTLIVNFSAGPTLTNIRVDYW